MQKKQRLLLALIIVAFGFILFLPWAGIPFYTKGEPREALVAQQMQETGNYILPLRYGDDVATKPPMTHWLISLFSLPYGNVNELSARIPSTLAGILIVAYLFLFLSKRSNAKRAFLACALLFGCFEWFRAVPSTRVDMPLTAFMVAAILQLYRWEERDLKGFPIWAVAFMSLATLVKGPVGIVLPCFVFFVFLLLRQYNFWRVCLHLIEISLPAMIAPAIWYWLAIRQGGDEFLAILIDENFSRFTGTMKIGGTHEASIWYMFGIFLAGLAPWILLALLSCLHIKKREKTEGNAVKNLWQKIKSANKTNLFAAVVIVCVLTFYAIPASKRSVYLLPAFPFVAIFLADLVIWLDENKKNALKIFSWIIFAIGVCAAVATTVSTFGFVNNNFYIALLGNVFAERGIIAYLIIAIIIAALIYQATQHIKHKKYIVPMLLTYFAVLLFFDAVYHPTMAEARTLKYFAQDAKAQAADKPIFAYEEKMYCLNYELHNKLKDDFDETKPQEAYVFITSRRIDDFKNKYKNEYNIETTLESANRYNELRRVVYLVHAKKIEK